MVVVVVEVVRAEVHLGARSVRDACGEEQRVSGEGLALLEVGLAVEGAGRVGLGVVV